MNHPYAPWIISALAVAILTGIAVIAGVIRADRRDSKRLAWDKVQAEFERRQRERIEITDDFALVDLINAERE